MIGFGPSILDNFSPYQEPAGNICIRFEAETMVLQELWFYNNRNNYTPRVEHTQAFNIFGNVNVKLNASGMIYDFAWVSENGAPLRFCGTADQNVTLPPGLAGLTWTVEKPKGTLDLQNVAGSLIGSAAFGRHAEKLIVCGPSIVTINSDLVFGEIQNFGQIIIPEGIVLRTEKIIAETGSSMTGAGTLDYKAPKGYYVDKNDPPSIHVKTVQHGVYRPFIKAK